MTGLCGRACSSIQTYVHMAELTEAYSNFSLPLLHSFIGCVQAPARTLVDQSEGLSPLLPAVDLEPATGPWRSTLPFQQEAVRLYRNGWSVNRIAVKLGVAWDSAALLLHKAGVRELKRKSR